MYLTVLIPMARLARMMTSPVRKCAITGAKLPRGESDLPHLTSTSTPNDKLPLQTFCYVSERPHTLRTRITIHQKIQEKARSTSFPIKS